MLLELAAGLAERLSPDELFDALAPQLQKLIGVDRASLTFYDPVRDHFDVIADALVPDGAGVKGRVVPHQGSRVGAAFDTGQPIMAPVETGHGAYCEDRFLAKWGMREGLTLPLVNDHGRLGTLNFDWKREGAPSEVDNALLADVARLLAACYERMENANALPAHESEVGGADSADRLVLLRPSLRPMVDRLIAIASSEAPILLTGETGTGKGVLARALHRWSRRVDGPFITCNCTALSPTLIESELFGHEKGAFTGAHVRRKGRFELADQGSLFLDEIGETTIELQAKLLGVVEDGEFHRVGGAHPIRPDARLIAATNRDLESEVHSGGFREDLFYRLNVLSICLPPLRECPDDIPYLVDHHVRRVCRAAGRVVPELSSQSMERLKAHSWPGNVRELANVVERALVLGGDVRTLEVTDDMFEASLQPAGSALLPLREVERRHVARVLEHTRGRVGGAGGAAEILGLHPNTLRSRLERLGLAPKPEESG